MTTMDAPIKTQARYVITRMHECGPDAIRAHLCVLGADGHLVGRVCDIAAGDPGAAITEMIAWCPELVGQESVLHDDISALLAADDDAKRGTLSPEEAERHEGVQLAAARDQMRAEQRAKCGPVLMCLADVEPKEIDWLWPDRIPCGHISMLAGRPGEGKSFMTADLAARVTRGTPWPDKTKCPQGSVIILAAEDDPAATIRPRLDACGADVQKIHLLTSVRALNDDEAIEERMPSLQDIPLLEQALAQVGDCRLLIVDPIGSYLAAATNSDKDNEVRSILTPLGKLAEKFGVAVLCVAHHRKATSGFADDLALGSRAFTGVARAVWHLARDADNRERRLLLPGKNNLAKSVGGLAFAIDGEPAKVQWESGPVLMSADEGVAAEAAANKSKPGPKGEARSAAAGWLHRQLGERTIPVASILEEADAAGFARATVQRAANQLDVIRSKTSGVYTWHLPVR